MKQNFFRVLIYLIGIDITLTFLTVGFLGAVEINPMHIDFQQFILIKLVVSTVGLLALSKMRHYPMWKVCVKILVVVYGVVLLFNLSGIARSII